VDYLLPHAPPLQGSVRERQSENLRTLQGTDICNVGKRCDDTATNATEMCCESMGRCFQPASSARSNLPVDADFEYPAPVFPSGQPGQALASTGPHCNFGSKCQAGLCQGRSCKKACRYFRYFSGMNTHWSSAFDVERSRTHESYISSFHHVDTSVYKHRPLVYDPAIGASPLERWRKLTINELVRSMTGLL